MKRVRNLLVPLMAVMLVSASVAVAQGQDAGQVRRRRSMRLSRGSLLGLLSLEQVQKELKLEKDKLDKIKEIGEKLTAEMRKEYAPLREIEDREQRRTKSTALAEKFDGKAREQLREVLAREQMMRLYQIRMQVRSVTESLANRFVAGRLKITDDQKKKLAKITKDAQAKRTELFSGLRDATQEKRTEAYQKYRKLREQADKDALAVLTDEQKKAFEQMKGKIIKLEMPQRGQRRPRTTT